MMKITALKKMLRLEPLPGEGGWFCETYRAPDPTPGAARPRSTAIYYLLTDEPGSFSAMHRLPGDEVYHFYLGDPLEMLLLFPDGRSQVVILGQDLSSGQVPQLVVPGGVWQGSRVRPGGRYSLLGTTMAPGYIPEDYEGGRRSDLCRLYPDQAAMISLLTRLESEK